MYGECNKNEVEEVTAYLMPNLRNKLLFYHVIVTRGKELLCLNFLFQEFVFYILFCFCQISSTPCPGNQILQVSCTLQEICCHY